MTVTKYNLVDSVAEWMTGSGIQNEEGGVYSWYDTTTNSYSYLYSEITGYSITAFLYLNKIYKSEKYIEHAEKSAQWIIKNALSDCGGVKTRYFIDKKAIDDNTSFEGGNMFSFDTAMVLYGFVNLYKETKKEIYLEYSKKMADFLIDTMQKEDGSFYAIYNEEKGLVEDSTKKWSTQPGSFHSKNAMGLVDLFEVTGEEKYKKSALKICEFALTKQDKSGRFITDSASKSTHIHPHCYTCEGLSYVGNTFNIKSFKKSAERATMWALSRVDEKGINEFYYPNTDSFSDFQRSDIIAQVIRMGLLYVRNSSVDQLVELLLAYRADQDKNGEGDAFYFSQSHEHVNFWCTMFAFQAIALYYDKDLIPKSGDRFDLLV